MKIKSPKTIKAVRTAAGPRCELCRQGWQQAVHHEPTNGSAGLDTRLTLIALCLQCHTERHSGTHAASQEVQIIEAICRREQCSAADREAVVFLLKRAPKEADRAWLGGQCQEWPASAVLLLSLTLTEAGR